MFNSIIADVPAKALYLTQPKGETDRIFILNQKGLIYIIKNGEILKKPFLDISDRVHPSLIPGNEEGLLGLAFHPDYLNNGYFFTLMIFEKNFAHNTCDFLLIPEYTLQ